jgi:hypothetical protein
MKLTKEQVELLANATAALDLGFDMNELDTSDVDSLRQSIHHTSMYYEMYNIDNCCPLYVETPYWRDYFSDKSVDELDTIQKSILNI